MEKTLVNRGKGRVCNSDAERVAREVRMHLQIRSTGGQEAGGRGRRVSTHYSLGCVHRPPLHVVILPLDVSQPLPEHLRRVIHIVIGGCPAGQKAQYDSVTSLKKKIRRKKHPRDPR